jgi:hypothetical protein
VERLRTNVTVNESLELFELFDTDKPFALFVQNTNRHVNISVNKNFVRMTSRVKDNVFPRYENFDGHCAVAGYRSETGT